MKNIVAVFLALALAVTSQFAFAAAAQITELKGKVEATPQTGATRTLKYGDTINELDTIQTGANSTVVLRFEDGHVAVLSANSRMKVSVYTYDFKDPAKGRVLLSLLAGGMRSITGQIGKTRPDRVSYRAGVYTVGILGTDVTIVSGTGSHVITVNNGEISVTPDGGAKINIRAPDAAIGDSVGQITTGDISKIYAALDPTTRAVIDLLGGQAWLLTYLQAEQTTNKTYTCGVSCN